MTATADTVEARGPGGVSWLWRRQLGYYPNTGARITYLVITVLATVMLYYELYVGASVSPQILANLNMTFTFYVTALAIGNLIGAFGSLLAGLADRFGRANLVVFGLLFTGIFVAFVLPNAPNKWAFTIEGFVVGVVEGICLVATPALIRDFSPQVGRATAMGFWTSGPVIGSLIVTAVGTTTIPAVFGLSDYRHVWAHEYVICGIAGLAVFVVALIGLRELSPNLRDQLMVTMHDRALIEARAKGLDIEAALRNPFRQLIKTDVVVSAFAISVFLLIYYSAVGFAVIYLTSVFGLSTKDANGLGNWNWGFNAVAVILIGVLSDRLRVRKPFMVVGAIGGAVMVAVYLLLAGLHPSYYTLAIVLALLSFTLGVAYTPWMASFTETVEARNPALIATGLAIWGWIIRIVVAVAFLIVPHVVTAVTPIVQYGPQALLYESQYPQLAFAQANPQIVAEARKLDAKYPTQVANATRLAPELAFIQSNISDYLTLSSYKSVAAIPAKVLTPIEAKAGGGTSPADLAKGATIVSTIMANQPAIKGVAAVSSKLTILQVYQKQLTALQKVPKSVQDFLTAHEVALTQAQAVQVAQWKRWYWVCFGGIIFFLFSIPLLRGRWTTAAARKDEAEHEAMVDAELAAMGAQA